MASTARRATSRQGRASYTRPLADPLTVMATNAPADALEDDDRDFVDEITDRVAIAVKGAPDSGCGC